MVTKKWTWSLLLIALLLFVPVFVVQAFGQEGSTGSPCSLATLSGVYSGVLQGTLVAPFPNFPPPPLPFAEITMHIYDGAGHFTGKNTASLDGVIITGTFTGTYTLTSDCSYSAVLTTNTGLVIHDVGTITGHGTFQEVREIWAVPGTVVSGTLKKVPPGGCSLESLKGTYAVLEQGTTVAGAQFPGLPPGPWLFTNYATPTYDGAGNFGGTYTASIGGAIVPGTFSGTYDVKPDCTVSNEFSPLPGLTLHHVGTIVGEGVSRQILYIYAEHGAVIAGTAQK